MLSVSSEDPAGKERIMWKDIQRVTFRGVVANTVELSSVRHSSLCLETGAFRPKGTNLNSSSPSFHHLYLEITNTFI